LVTELAAGFTGGFEGGGRALTPLGREVRVVALAFGPGPVLVEPPFTFRLSVFLVAAALLELDPTLLRWVVVVPVPPCLWPALLAETPPPP
jgi:hypothetical protein